MSQKDEILLGYFRENKSQRAISRELKISRDTVSKYIKEFESKSEHLDKLQKDEKRNEEEILLLIEEMSSTPKYDTSSRTRIKLTDQVIEDIQKLLKINERNWMGYTI